MNLNGCKFFTVTIKTEGKTTGEIDWFLNNALVEASRQGKVVLTKFFSDCKRLYITFLICPGK